MKKYLESSSCLRQFLSKYFGVCNLECPLGHLCCDICTNSCQCLGGFCDMDLYLPIGNTEEAQGRTVSHEQLLSLKTELNALRKTIVTDFPIWIWHTSSTTSHWQCRIHLFYLKCFETCWCVAKEIRCLYFENFSVNFQWCGGGNKQFWLRFFFSWPKHWWMDGNLQRPIFHGITGHVWMGCWLNYVWGAICT